MKRFASLALLLVAAHSLAAATKPALPHLAEKQLAAASIDKQRDQLTALSDQVWRYAETALQETKSSKALADFAEQKGFRVTRGVAGMPTAFVAEYGSGRPVIGIMGEYDALPGLSQKSEPQRAVLDPGAPGHGCGHNLFGVGSLAAATAVKELIAAGKLHGTIKFFGTPAEEAVGGKLYMLREGVMNGVDVMLAWHPDDETKSDTKSTQAIVDVTVEFFGRAAHAAYDPWNGRSAVDGLEIFTHAVNMMREHIRPSSRMHYAILKGGDVPNVVPEYGKVWIWLRDEKRDLVDEMLGRLRKMAAGAAMAADVESKLTVNGGDWNMLVNMSGQRLAQQNLEWLGPLPFTPEEQEYGKAREPAAGEGTQSGAQTVRGEPGTGRRRIDRRGRHQLEHADHPHFGGHRSHRRPVARLVRRRLRRNVHRAQGNDPRLQGARRDDDRPLYRRGERQSGARRIRQEDGGSAVQGLHSRRPAAAALGELIAPLLS
jgi:aminobenzoyl-glutamate utilization protein B